MSNELEISELIHSIHTEKEEKNGKRHYENTELAFQWTSNRDNARSIAEAIEDFRNILIMGPVASGKSLLVNDLLRMTLPEDRFRFIYRSPREELSEFELASEFHHRVEYSINLENQPFHVIKKGISSDQQSYWEKPSFYVIDDIHRKDLVTITNRVKADMKLPLISTIQWSTGEDLQFIDLYLKKNFDVFILLNGYKDISNVLFSNLHL